MNTKKTKYKLKSKPVNEPKKFVQGTQSLNSLPDYSFYYNAQEDAYNRRARESYVNEGILSNISNSVGKVNFTGITNTASNLIDTASIKSDGKQNEGASIASNALKYGGQGATIGSAFGPIGTGIGAGVGLLAGGIYGGIQARNLNNKIDTGKRLDKIYGDYLAAGQSYDYNTQGDINSEVGKATGFAKNGKYKLKMKKSK